MQLIPKDLHQMQCTCLRSLAVGSVHCVIMHNDTDSLVGESKMVYLYCQCIISLLLMHTTLVWVHLTVHQTTWCHIPQGDSIHSHCCENHKCHLVESVGSGISITYNIMFVMAGCTALFLKQRKLEEVRCTLNQQPWIEVVGSRKLWMEILLTF